MGPEHTIHDRPRSGMELVVSASSAVVPTFDSRARSMSLYISVLGFKLLLFNIKIKGIKLLVTAQYNCLSKTCG